MHQYNFRLLTLGLLLAACSAQNGTETDNPLVDEPEPPPPYESPGRFNPDDPGPPGCPPPNDDTFPARGPYWDDSGTLLVGVDRRRGLVVMDTAEPGALEELSTTILDGFTHALLVSGKDVAVVIDEIPDVAEDSIPTPDELAPQLKLLHLDISDPQNPVRRGSVELPGEFWRLVERDGVVWVMQAELAAQEPSCSVLPGHGCYYPARTALMVEGYRFADDGFEAVESVRLPMRQRAWAGQDGFVSQDSDADERGEPLPRALHIARFEAATLVTSELSLDLAPKEFAPVGVAGQNLYYFTEADGGASSVLHIVDVSGEQAVELSQVSGLPAAPRVGTFFSERRVVVGEESFAGAGSVISLDDPAAPVVTSLPPRVAMALPLAALPDAEPRLLGWGDVDGSGFATVGIVGEDGLERVLQTSLPVGSLQEGLPLYPQRLLEVGNHVAFSYRVDTPEQRVSRLGLLAIDADPLTLREVDDAGVDDELLAIGNVVLAPSATGVVSVTVDDGARSWFDFEYRRVIDLLPTAEGYVALQQRLGGRTEALIAEMDDEVAATIELPGGARRIVPAGDFVLVLVDAQGNECEQAGGMSCDERSILVLDPRGQPALVGSVDLPSTNVPSERLERNWLDPVKSKDGGWIFAAVERASCIWIAECEALGIDYVPLSEANVAFGTPADCPPSPAACPEPPPPPEVYGTRTRQELYRLDLTDVAKPRLRALGTPELELPDSRFGPVRVFDDAVLATRLEIAPEPGQAAYNARARFMVDRFSTGESSPPWRTLNVPGYPVWLADDDSVLYSVEPIAGSDRAATFYRLRVEDNGAYIEASRELLGRYGDLRVIGERAYYVRQGLDGCSSGELQPIALDDSLTLLESLALPGTQWETLDSSGNQLLLRGPNYAGYALFDLEPAGPELRGYFRKAILGETARLDAGDIWAPVDSYGILHIEP